MSENERTRFNELDCIKAFSETGFTDDLKKFDVPTVIIHGDDDQIVPITASALFAVKLIKNTTLKIYPGGSHGLADTHKDRLNADLLAFTFVVAFLAMVGCGNSDNSGNRREQNPSKAANDPYDLQFIDNMVVHHQSAMDMAKLAESKALHAELKDFAKAIVADQEREIAQMK